MDFVLLNNYRLELQTLCRELGHFVKSQIYNVSPNDVESKDVNSLVSYVDKETEKSIVSHLSGLIPEAGFITEENTISQEKKALMWVIDPLDGTTNFLYKIPIFSISIALMENDDVVLGIVYDVMHDTAFTAIKSAGAWENDVSIRVSSNSDRSKAMVVTGFPYDRTDKIDERLALLKHFILNYRGIRRLGSAAIDLAYVASGRMGVYYENTLNIWDIAAGALIVQEGGGIVSDFSGGKNYLQDGSIIATNEHFIDDVSEHVRSHLS